MPAEDLRLSNEKVLQQIEEYKEKTKKLNPILKAVVLDNGEYTQYAKFNENRCSLCQSIYRDEAEKLYLEIRKIDPVRKLLIEKDKERGVSNPSWSWATVDTHMREHVDFTPISIDFMQRIQDTKEEYSVIEREPIGYGKRMLIDMIAEMKSIDLSKNLDQLIKVNQVVNSLLGTYKNFTTLEYEISGLRDEAESAVMEMADKFTEVMADLMQKITGIDNKEYIKDGIKDFQDFLKSKLERKSK